MFSIGQRPKGWKGKQRLIDQDGKDVCFLLEWRRFFDKCSLVIAFVPQPLFSFNDNHFAIMLRHKPSAQKSFWDLKGAPLFDAFCLVHSYWAVSRPLAKPKKFIIWEGLSCYVLTLEFQSASAPARSAPSASAPYETPISWFPMMC